MPVQASVFHPPSFMNMRTVALTLPVLAIVIQAAPADLKPRVNCAIRGTPGTIFQDSYLMGQYTEDLACTDACTNVASYMNDLTSSFVINAGNSCTFYVEANCSGLAATFAAATYNYIPPDLNDKISSYRCTSHA
ncbi:hypothetical protein DL96DRAFT_1623150 [Flagelloscypha sp. PMI_526]|nr:hypothetical protein DL96DRAFT_1623150 [Flagelloscypha sp. PMI_526]